MLIFVIAIFKNASKSALQKYQQRYIVIVVEMLILKTHQKVPYKNTSSGT